ncbi:MAG: hypothetical protein MJZ89_06740 [Paludibacteraceae bacterium]|nr:hypothetical protein [Paludibacteraceae bacterium]
MAKKYIQPVLAIAHLDGDIIATSFGSPYDQLPEGDDPSNNFAPGRKDYDLDYEEDFDIDY